MGTTFRTHVDLSSLSKGNEELLSVTPDDEYGP
ncbi:hypothetical protein M2251_003171 [Rhodococcus erythropolis]|nr:hypothetical protein [Rhodococcus erythropolis]